MNPQHDDNSAKHRAEYLGRIEAELADDANPPTESGAVDFAKLSTEDVYDLAQIGAEWVREGPNDNAKFTEKLVTAFGESMRPHAAEIFEAATHFAKIIEMIFEGECEPPPHSREGDAPGGADEQKT